MPTIAFSTIACPDFTLEQVVDVAARLEFDGVELRTFGSGSTQFVSDPALIASAKTRHLFRDAGVRVLSLATSIRFDAPIRPRVIGRVFGDQEASVREAKRAIGLAAQLECPLVRVCGFETPPNERKSSTMKLIVDRLKAVADNAHRTGVRIALENGGSFSTADDINEILDKVNSPLVGASWCMRTGMGEGEAPLPESIAPRSLILRLRDVGGNSSDQQACREAIETLSRGGPSDACVVYEWCKAWVDSPGDSNEVLASAATSLFAATARDASPTTGV